MELSSASFFSELVVDDLGFSGDPRFNPFESSRYDLDFCSFFSGSNSPITPESLCDPDACSLLSPMLNPKMISFGQLYSFDEIYGIDSDELSPRMEELCEEEMRFWSIHSASKKRTFGEMSKTPVHAKVHVLAERKRREKLSRLFVELSAIIPGLKKLDKASVLEDAIKHMKELKEHVKALEGGLAMDSVVSVNRSRLERNDGNSGCTTPPFEGYNGQLPDVAVRVSDKHVLFKIHCEKHQARIVPIFNEIEKLNLTILSQSVLSFGNSNMDITVIAKMDVNFSLTIDDLTRNLRRALINSP